MLTQFDTELFPNDCEVVEMLSHNQFVYLIQKNGSSSLRREVRDNNLKVYSNHEIVDLDTIDVYIRDPQQRYISGVNTYIQQLIMDHPYLDPDTCTWFATRYNFLNRHYLPQFLWLVNLSRFLKASTQIRLRNFQDIGNITKHNKDAGIVKPSTDFVNTLLSNTKEDMRLWWFLDQMLQDMSGRSLTFQEIIEYVKQHPSGVYNTFTQRLSEIAKTLLP